MNDVWDVVVIGGGPAGMMSAGVAGARGLKVLLLEKNPTLGKKLRITGGGRCNITNATFDNRTLLANYKEANKFLFSAFDQHSVKDTLDFFHQNGLLTKTEAENRVFPVSDKAEDVARVLEKNLITNGVVIRNNVVVTKINTDGKQIINIETTKGPIYAKSFILATGGTSRPDTGSTGDGYKWLREIEHTVNTPIPSLVPIVTKETWIQDVAGVSIQDARIIVKQNNSLVTKKTGKILFTHNGLSGPAILNLSSVIGECLNHGTVTLEINISPEYSEETLSNTLRDLCITNANRKIKNVLQNIIPTSLTSIILSKTNIDSERKCNTITRNERHELITNIRNLTVTVSHLLGPDKAVVANGGVALTEIDFSTMSSRIYPNLYIVGDMLDIQRPSGGYSLQLCWTTGFVAGSACGKKI